MSVSTSVVAPPLIEQIRSNHEEIERLEELVMKELMTEQVSPMKQLFQGYRLRIMAMSILLKTKKLVETYEVFPHEMTSVLGQPATWTNVSYDFYSRFEQINQGDNPYTRLFNADEDYEALLKQEPSIGFSEGFGRYLDLHAMHKQYINSDFGEKVEYSAYLDVFSQPEKIPRELKSSRKYTLYIADLLEYLISFFLRTEPLQDLDIMLYKVSTDFKKQYEDGKVEGWGNHGHEDELIRYHTMRDIQNLIDAKHEKLNKAMGSLGLITGGTLRQHAYEIHRLKMHPYSEMPQLLMEAQVKKLCNLLDETIERTKQNVRKKLVLASEEMEGENPLMGWDGKPIPYWLCKLGLGQQYKCEICGNCSYAGKRAFERHFKEWPHQGGLRRLGIPDTEKNFEGITSIEEAKELWKRISKRKTSTLAKELPHWEIKGEEVKEKNSNLAPAGVAIPPPDIRTVLETVAHVVSITGLEHDVIALYEGDEKLNFWKSSGPYHAFYQHKLTEYRAQNPEDAARIESDKAAATNRLPAEYMVPPRPLEGHKFTYRLPEGITRKDLDIIKLTAEFWVRSKGCYFKGFSEREIREHQLEFTNKPTDGRFYIFLDFVRAYSEVLKNCPKTVKEKLRKNAADIETVLENCYHRLQWDRFRREHREKKAREGSVVQLPRRHFPPQPQLEPEATKRQKIDESELVPEKEFLAEHPGVAKINVGIPKHLSHGYIEIFVPSLLESVASLKERITLLMEIPASKQELSGKTGLFKDNRSLAHYNVEPGELLILSWGEEDNADSCIFGCR